MMRILQPATNSRSSHIQAVAGALMVGLIFGLGFNSPRPLLTWWFWPLLVLVVSPIFLWRLSGWTEGFGFGLLQIFRMLMILALIMAGNMYAQVDDRGTLGQPAYLWGFIVCVIVATLSLSFLDNFSSRPGRERLRSAVDLVTPALGLPLLAIWFYRFLQVPSPSIDHDYDRVMTDGLKVLVVAASLIPLILLVRPLVRIGNLRDLLPQKPASIIIGLSIEITLIFALFGGFRTLIGLTAIGWDELYRSYAGNFIFSLIRFFKDKGIFILLLMVSSYCAVPWKPVRFRRALLGTLAVLVVLSVAVHYPVFFRPGQFPAPPASILAPNNDDWRMSIPLDLAKGIKSGPNCRQVTFYSYLNPVSLTTEEHCIRQGEETVRVLLDRLNSPEMHPAAVVGYSNALNTLSPAEFIRYAGRTGIFIGANSFVKAEPEPDLRNILDQMEHEHLRLYPKVACGFARAFHHFGDEHRAGLYLAICGPYGYQDTFNQIYLSQSVVKGRVVDVPWPRDRFRMEFSLSRKGTPQESTPIGPDGSFALTGVTVGKHEGWIIVHGNPRRWLGPKKDLLVVYSNSASFEVNGTDPVDLGDIWIKIFPDHPAPELLPAASTATWFKLPDDNYWERVKNLPDPFSAPDRTR